jgi:hypothetical protein
VKAISYGGGVQSTALLVLACTGAIEMDVALFANVGDDSENPATLDYLADYAAPYAKRHGLPLHQLRRTWRTGEQTTLYQYVTGPIASLPIPVYMAGGAPGTRQCSERWKIGVVARWLRDNNTSGEKAELAIGFSWDELERVKDIADPIATRTYPLIDMRLNRADCAVIIRDAGLPVPPKSSCWFCPYRGARGFAEMRRDDPETFDRAVALEDRVNEKRAEMGRDDVHLTGTGRRLALLPAAQDALFDVDEDGHCTSEACFT